jgi:hypothetical protein
VFGLTEHSSKPTWQNVPARSLGETIASMDCAIGVVGGGRDETATFLVAQRRLDRRRSDWGRHWVYLTRKFTSLRLVSRPLIKTPA